MKHLNHFTDEPLAIDAGAHDRCQCKDCHLFVPGGEMHEYAHGKVCVSCHENRQDHGLARDLFAMGAEAMRGQGKEIQS